MRKSSLKNLKAWLLDNIRLLLNNQAETTQKSFWYNLAEIINDCINEVKNKIDRIIQNIMSVLLTVTTQFISNVRGWGKYQIFSGHPNAYKKCQQMPEKFML